MSGNKYEPPTMTRSYWLKQ